MALQDNLGKSEDETSLLTGIECSTVSETQISVWSEVLVFPADPSEMPQEYLQFNTWLSSHDFITRSFECSLYEIYFILNVNRRN